MNDQRIKLIRPCEWEEVFLEWYKNEGTNPNWIKLAQDRGHASWADWRINGYARRFACAQADWALYEIIDPAAVVSGWYGGPFRTWIEKWYNGGKAKTFSELADLPTIASHAGIRSRIENYPVDSAISALELPDGRVFVIEGMHRACALALAKKEGKPTPEKLLFAIGRSDLSELPPVGKNTLNK